MAKCNTKMRTIRRKNVKTKEQIIILPQPVHVMSHELQDLVRANIIDAYQIGDVLESTVRENQKMALKYLDWCKGCCHAAVPCSDEQAEAFVIYAANQTTSKETLQKWVLSLKWIHRMCGMEFDIPARVKRRAKAALNTGMVKPPKQSNPITAEILDYLMTKVNTAKRSEMLPMLILMMQHSIGGRIDEVRLLTRHQTRIHDDGTADVLIARSKTDQGGVGMWRMLNRTTYGYWIRYQKMHGCESKYLISRENGEAFTEGSLKAVVRAFLRQFDVDASSHGARIGFVQDAFRAGVDIGQITKYGGWTSAHMPYYYLRSLSVPEVGRNLGVLMGR
ncbi:MAG: hypothetical protein BWK73_20225 [Thiothrix lacustris]|uniref:Uncharacterized protein n=1 Tax=Thiothrix lacustris TaxID=525917 RepID=A0A1Y1QPK7_9GAMM|nr:MAG: hypothetical protein BWK73_20225 [Thiothrix lacustris]